MSPFSSGVHPGNLSKNVGPPHLEEREQILQGFQSLAQRLLEMWKLVRQTLARMPPSTELHPLLKAARNLEVDYPILEPGSPIADDLTLAENPAQAKVAFDRNERRRQLRLEQGEPDAESSILEVWPSPNPTCTRASPDIPSMRHTYSRLRGSEKRPVIDGCGRGNNPAPTLMTGIGGARWA